MKQAKRTYRITLMEVMIVIFLIGLIAGVIGYNMKGSLDEGRVFRTETAINQLRDILLLQVAKGDATLEEAITNPKRYLELSGMAKNADKLLVDGWGEPFTFSIKGSDIAVFSDKLKTFKDAKKKKMENQTAEKKPEIQAPTNPAPSNP
jgi:general secretion pathway protein G